MVVWLPATLVVVLRLIPASFQWKHENIFLLLFFFWHFFLLFACFALSLVFVCVVLRVSRCLCFDASVWNWKCARKCGEGGEKGENSSCLCLSPCDVSWPKKILSVNASVSVSLRASHSTTLSQALTCKSKSKSTCTGIGTKALTFYAMEKSQRMFA